VEDTGIGIPAAEQHRLFTPFGKLEDPKALNAQGCGLGLSISNALVERLGGRRIVVLSRPELGSVFSFEVDIESQRCHTPPLEEEPSAAAESHSQSLPACSWSGSYTPTHPQVLIVDDNFLNRLVARKLIESRGYACAEATTGLEAVQQLLSNQQVCTFILMDVEMPEMDGIAATAEIRRLESAGRLQSAATIVGCSANCSPQDKEAALACGMDFFLEKPLQREQLNRLLTDHFGLRDETA